MPKQKDKKKRVGFLANIKPGALSQELGIPEEQNIPVTLLTKIKNAKPGTRIKNPTAKGHSSIQVTATTKKRASLALQLKQWKK